MILTNTNTPPINAALVKALRERTGAGVIACKNALVEAGGDMHVATERLREEETARAAKKAERVAAEGLVTVAVEGSAAAIIELNTETDFVARNDVFREAATSLARLALVVKGDYDALRQAPSPDGDGDVSSLVARLTARTGEHVHLRRSAYASVSNGAIASYVHNMVAPGLGSIGVLLALEGAGPPATMLEIGRKIAMHIAASAPQWVAIDDVPPAIAAEKRVALVDEAVQSGKPSNIVDKMVDGRMRRFFDEVTLMHQPFVLNPDQTVGQVLAEAAAEAGFPIAVKSFVRFRVGDGVRQ